MAAPHIARVTNRAKVNSAMEFHDTLETVFIISSFILTCCEGGGWIRSLVTTKATIKKASATAAKMAIVDDQPCCSVEPSEKWFTNGNVRPCTTNWAIVTTTKRIVVMLVRSRISLVMTPPKEVYGILLKE